MSFEASTYLSENPARADESVKRSVTLDSIAVEKYKNQPKPKPTKRAVKISDRVTSSVGSGNLQNPSTSSTNDTDAENFETFIKENTRDIIEIVRSKLDEIQAGFYTYRPKERAIALAKFNAQSEHTVAIEKFKEIFKSLFSTVASNGEGNEKERKDFLKYLENIVECLEFPWIKPRESNKLFDLAYDLYQITLSKMYEFTEGQQKEIREKLNDLYKTKLIEKLEQILNDISSDPALRSVTFPENKDIAALQIKIKDAKNIEDYSEIIKLQCEIAEYLRSKSSSQLTNEICFRLHKQRLAILAWLNQTGDYKYIPTPEEQKSPDKKILAKIQQSVLEYGRGEIIYRAKWLAQKRQHKLESSKRQKLREFYHKHFGRIGRNNSSSVLSYTADELVNFNKLLGTREQRTSELPQQQSQGTPAVASTSQAETSTRQTLTAENSFEFAVYQIPKLIFELDYEPSNKIVSDLLKIRREIIELHQDAGNISKEQEQVLAFSTHKLLLKSFVKQLNDYIKKRKNPSIFDQKGITYRLEKLIGINAEKIKEVEKLRDDIEKFFEKIGQGNNDINIVKDYADILKKLYQQIRSIKSPNSTLKKILHKHINLIFRIFEEYYVDGIYLPEFHFADKQKCEFLHYFNGVDPASEYKDFEELNEFRNAFVEYLNLKRFETINETEAYIKQEGEKQANKNFNSQSVEPKTRKFTEIVRASKNLRSFAHEFQSHFNTYLLSMELIRTGELSASEPKSDKYLNLINQAVEATGLPVVGKITKVITWLIGRKLNQNQKVFLKNLHTHFANHRERMDFAYLLAQKFIKRLEHQLEDLLEEDSIKDLAIALADRVIVTLGDKGRDEIEGNTNERIIKLCNKAMFDEFREKIFFSQRLTLRGENPVFKLCTLNQLMRHAGIMVGKVESQMYLRQDGQSSPERFGLIRMEDSDFTYELPSYGLNFVSPGKVISNPKKSVMNKLLSPIKDVKNNKGKEKEYVFKTDFPLRKEKTPEEIKQEKSDNRLTAVEQQSSQQAEAQEESKQTILTLVKENKAKDEKIEALEQQVSTQATALTVLRQKYEQTAKENKQRISSLERKVEMLLQVQQQQKTAKGSTVASSTLTNNNNSFFQPPACPPVQQQEKEVQELTGTPSPSS